MIYSVIMRDEILVAVSEVMGVSVDQMKSKSIKSGVSEARGIYFLVGKMAGIKPGDLSELVNKGISSANALAAKYKMLCDADEKLRSKRDRIIELISSGLESLNIAIKPLWCDDFKILDVSSIYSGESYIGIVKGIPVMNEKSFYCIANRMLGLKTERHE